MPAAPETYVSGAFYVSPKMLRIFGERGYRCALRLGCAPMAHNSTLAPRKVFFPTYTPRGKTISFYFAPPGAKLLRRAFLYTPSPGDTRLRGRSGVP